MKEQHPIDDLFSEKLSHRQHPFDEVAWEAAADLLDQQQAEKKRRFPIFWWWGSGALAVALLLALWGVFQGSGDRVQGSGIRVQESPIADRPLAAQDQRVGEGGWGMSQGSEFRDQGSESKDLGSQPRLSPAGGGVGGGKVLQDQGSTSNTELHLVQESPIVDRPLAAQDQRVGEGGWGMNQGSGDRVQGSEFRDQGSESKDLGSQPRLSPAGGGVGGGKVLQDQGSSSSAELHSVQESPIADRPLAAQDQREGEGGWGMNQGSGDRVQGSEIKDQVAEFRGQGSTSSEVLPSNQVAPQAAHISTLPPQSSKLLDTKWPYAPGRVQTVVSDPFLRHHLGWQIGAVLSPGLGENLAEVNWITRPQIGLHYAYAIRPRWRMHTGLNYAQQGVEELSKSFTSRSFGFGFESETQTLNPQSLHFVEVPVQLERRFGNRHFLQFGLQAGYLLQVSSQWTNSSANSFQEAQGTTETRWGYRQGFRSWQLRPTLGYGYYLGKGFILGIQGQAGVSEVLDGSFYEPARPMRNLQFRATLTYDLWNF